MLRHIQGFFVSAITISFINLLDLIDPKKCFALIRLIRWGETVLCPKCGSHHVIKRGFDDTQPDCQRYQCKHCQTRFDDLGERKNVWRLGDLGNNYHPISLLPYHPIYHSKFRSPVIRG